MKLTAGCKAESSRDIAARVSAAREIQKERLAGCGIFTNAEMTGKMIPEFCRLSPECRDFMEKAVESMGLSARAYHRILKLGRTIADMEGSGEILLPHLMEASRYRLLDRRDLGIV